MNIVKLTCPVEWNITLPNLKTQFHRLTPKLSASWDDYTFLINDSSTQCDYWLVYGFLEQPETVVVNKQSVLLLSEEVAIKRWNDRFINQFDVVTGSQVNINHPNYYHDQYICGWQVKKSYDQLIDTSPIQKSKQLSMIASSVRSTIGHRKRYDFAKRIKNHFGDNIDWFGKGNNFIDDKWDGLSDHKFSIAIENQYVNDYFTEKIMDCYLAYTIPIYYGCPNIDKYFPKGSYINIDIDNIAFSIRIIEEAINSNYYEVNFNALIQARELVLNKYQFMPKITTLLNEIHNEHVTKTLTLFPETYFTKQSLSDKIKNAMHKLLR